MTFASFPSTGVRICPKTSASGSAMRVVTGKGTRLFETTNFHHERNWRGSSDGMKLTERFTLVDPKTIRYEFTVEDPATWVRPWSVESVLPRIEPPLYEFACHEQNYGLMNVVKGAQVREAEAAARKK